MGSISVVTAPGGGTEFRVYLPLYTGEKPPEPTENRPTINTYGTETVLVVEDDAAIMKLHREVLTRYGYVVLMAADGVEAVEIFNAHHDEIRLALVDVIMPRMNGREVVEKIRALCPELPIIMTSGYTDDIIDRAGIKALNVTFLQKPVKPLELLAAIGSYVQTGEGSG
jgi:CheY-like chemotaxis protein